MPVDYHLGVCRIHVIPKFVYRQGKFEMDMHSSPTSGRATDRMKGCPPEICFGVHSKEGLYYCVKRRASGKSLLHDGWESLAKFLEQKNAIRYT